MTSAKQCILAAVLVKRAAVRRIPTEAEYAKAYDPPLTGRLRREHLRIATTTKSFSEVYVLHASCCVAQAGERSVKVSVFQALQAEAGSRSASACSQRRL